MTIKKLFIANRGEIAVRIIRAAKALNIQTVQGYSEADFNMLPVRMADESICIGGSQASKSYLNADAIISAALSVEADTIHPGYGFLSESATFVRAVEAAGLTFVGPSAEVIERMGDKASARKTASSLGLPVVPGSEGRIEDINHALRISEEIGFPIMIKAVAGGGGRGIRIAETACDLKRFAKVAQAEAQAAFGDGGLYLEKLVSNPRHIEVQLLADGRRAVHFFERECSIQRRRQKVWEEAPAFGLSEATRVALCRSAVALAEELGYCGAGTVEFIYDTLSDNFFFIEMNTRIQVEHPVTEAITGFDLVAEMLQIASGKPLSVQQDKITYNGHAIEVRINAEDPARNFIPFPGKVGEICLPHGEGIRIDHFLFEGYQIPPYYDSLLGKLIVHAETRSDAIISLQKALKNMKIGGIKNTIPLHLELCNSPDIKEGLFHTQWLEKWLCQ